MLPFTEPTLMIVPWHDSVVDPIGHDVCGTYVELFWLNILGPTATWALRRLVAGLDRFPLGYELDLADTAAALGLSYSAGTSNTFGRALQRCVLFGTAQLQAGGLAVRRRLPPVGPRHLARMPLALREEHARWATREAALDDLDRGRKLATVMIELGDDPLVVERQLLAVGVSPAAAAVMVSDRSWSPAR